MVQRQPFTVIKNLPKDKSTGADGSTGEFHWTFRDEPMSILPKIFQNTMEEGTPLNSLYKASITLISKPDKDNTKNENYRPISLVNLDANILSKILENRIKLHIQKFIHHD